MSRRSRIHRACFGWVEVELLPPGPYNVHYRSDRTVIGVALERQRGVHSFASDRVRSFDAWPNSIAVTPRGMDTFSQSSDGGEYLRLLPDSALAGQKCVSLKLPSGDRIMREGDRRSGMLARRIRRALLARTQEAEDIESLCVELLHGCSFHNECPSRTRGSRYAGDRPRLARAMEFAAANLEGPLPLNKLADAADMSLFRFLRSFSMTIGMTPHAWIVEQRLQEARTQLENGNAGLADVAISCGFSSQSHMTEVFSRSMGTSPARYRRNGELV